MAFTDMLKNQYTGGRGAGVADTGSSTGSSSYGNGFLGTFANLVLGNQGNQESNRIGGSKLYDQYGFEITNSEQASDRERSAAQDRQAGGYQGARWG